MITYLNSKFHRYRGELTVLLCSALYLLWFCVLEHTVTDGYHIIHVGLDDRIPFIEYFIVPYLFWFIYVPLGLWAVRRRDRRSFYRACTFLFTGMFISLFICTFYPNGTNFRPHPDPEKNIFAAIVAFLYRTDTCTNVLPSIHVYNSIGVHIALTKAGCFKDNRFLRTASLIACVSICLSTMFLKQHSVVDVFAAVIMAYVVYDVVYEPVGAADFQGRKRKLAKPVDATD